MALAAADHVYYVLAGAAGGGDGSYASPYNTWAAFDSAREADAGHGTGDIIECRWEGFDNIGADHIDMRGWPADVTLRHISWDHSADAAVPHLCGVSATSANSFRSLWRTAGEHIEFIGFVVDDADLASADIYFETGATGSLLADSCLFRDFGSSKPMPWLMRLANPADMQVSSCVFLGTRQTGAAITVNNNGGSPNARVHNNYANDCGTTGGSFMSTAGSVSGWYANNAIWNAPANSSMGSGTYTVATNAGDASEGTGLRTTGVLNPVTEYDSYSATATDNTPASGSTLEDGGTALGSNPYHTTDLDFLWNARVVGTIDIGHIERAAAGGGPVEAAVSLAQGLTVGFADIATLESAVALDTNVAAVADGSGAFESVLSLPASVLLGIDAGIDREAAAALPAAIDAALDSDVSLEAFASFPVAAVLTAQAIASRLGSVVFDAGNAMAFVSESGTFAALTLSQAQTAGFSVTYTAESAVVLDSAQAVIFTGETLGELEAVLTLSAGHAMTPDAQAVFESAMAMDADLAAALAGSNITDSAVVIGHDNVLVLAGDTSIEGTLSIAFSAFAANEQQTDAGAAITLSMASAVQTSVIADQNVQLDLLMQHAVQLVGAATIEAGLSLDAVHVLSVSGSVIVFGITTPDERTFRVTFDLRTFNIGFDDRTWRV